MCYGYLPYTNNIRTITGKKHRKIAVPFLPQYTMGRYFLRRAAASLCLPNWRACIRTNILFGYFSERPEWNTILKPRWSSPFGWYQKPIPNFAKVDKLWYVSRFLNWVISYFLEMMWTTTYYPNKYTVLTFFWNWWMKYLHGTALILPTWFINYNWGNSYRRLWNISMCSR